MCKRNLLFCCLRFRNLSPSSTNTFPVTTLTITCSFIVWQRQLETRNSLYREESNNCHLFFARELWNNEWNYSIYLLWIFSLVPSNNPIWMIEFSYQLWKFNMLRHVIHAFREILSGTAPLIHDSSKDDSTTGFHLFFWISLVLHTCIWICSTQLLVQLLRQPNACSLIPPSGI